MKTSERALSTMFALIWRCAARICAHDQEHVHEPHSTLVAITAASIVRSPACHFSAKAPTPHPVYPSCKGGQGARDNRRPRTGPRPCRVPAHKLSLVGFANCHFCMGKQNTPWSLRSPIHCNRTTKRLIACEDSMVLGTVSPSETSKLALGGEYARRGTRRSFRLRSSHRFHLSAASLWRGRSRIIRGQAWRNVWLGGESGCGKM